MYNTLESTLLNTSTATYPTCCFGSPQGYKEKEARKKMGTMRFEVAEIQNASACSSGWSVVSVAAGIALTALACD